jgi:glycerophosphoryl diester phosphodiesterase
LPAKFSKAKKRGYMDRKKSIIVYFLVVILTPLLIACQHTSGALLKSERIKIIAHRGAPKIAPENTLPAIKAALEIGVDMIEIDVHQTKDHYLVVIHNEKVDKTTNGRGYVREMTLDEIKSLDAGSWFDTGFAGTTVPTLQEVFEIMDDTTRLLIEIKKGSPFYPDIEARVLEAVEAHDFRDRVLIKSFERHVVEYFHNHAPDIPAGKSFAYHIPFLGLIIDRGLRCGSVYSYKADFLHPHRLTASQRHIGKAREAGYKVFVWDVHTEERMRKFIERGVHAIETDYPDVLKRILEEQ